ncbi:MAG: TetR/AcrR family transcriptional regulator [Burkholderiales bacterium]|nr:TetR/AcrR family transcriptional regulator [Burkholderiales bacterium]
MARKKTQSFDDQKEVILQGAAELFARRGYLGASMNDVAQACGLSKASLYHYYRDKDDLLANIAEAHVARLAELVKSVQGDASIAPADRLDVLITRFLTEYADAQNSHRVLTEDVKFLPPVARERILQLERVVVNGFAHAIGVQRPDLAEAGLHKAVAMLLFGMLNWMFTWMRPDGALNYVTIAPLVRDLFFRGLGGIQIPSLAKPPVPRER